MFTVQRRSVHNLDTFMWPVVVREYLLRKHAKQIVTFVEIEGKRFLRKVIRRLSLFQFFSFSIEFQFPTLFLLQRINSLA